MKCPECSGNHRRKSGMRCSCGYDFILDPKSDGYADNKLIAAARRASGNGERYFTPRQLATEVLAMRGSGASSIGCGMLLLLGSVVLIIANPTAWFVGTILGVGAMVGLHYGLIGIHKFDYEQFRKALHKYDNSKGPLPRMLRNDRPLTDPPPTFEEDDLFQYGAEGILITQRPLLTDLLVLNGFHETQRMVVVAESGYPDYLVPRINRILEEQPALPVFVLHDANASGEGMASRVQKSKIFSLSNRAITDLGLSLDDLKLLPKLSRLARIDGDVAIDHLRFVKLSNGLITATSGTEAASLVEHIGRDPEAFVSGFG